VKENDLASDGPRSQSVIVYPGFRDYPITSEYLLPCNEMPAKVRECLHPWLRQMVEIDSQNVLSILHRRWSNISIADLTGLQDLLLKEFSPRSIITHGMEAWLGFTRPNPTDSERSEILIPPPPDTKMIETGLKKTPFANIPSLVAFAANFGSIKEDIPPNAGDFRIPEKWESLYDYWGENDGRYENWYSDWSGALVVYGTGCGDMVLLHPTGKMAWLGFAENEIWGLSSSFDEFIRRYVVYRRKSHFSLDRDFLDR
jgi:hypothetical protein